jgi:DDE superfamily endonuclease
VRIKETVKVLVDSGYQGIRKFHENSHLPKKNSKKKPLTKQEKKDNHDISSERVLVENVIRKIKIFRVMAEKYRNRRRRFTLRLNLISAIINYEL